VIDVACVNLVLQPGGHPTLKPGTYVQISLTDHGIGIPAEILPRIFDPFFTTKQKGSGLGLAIVYSILQRHEGCVEVDSEPGKGSTFRLYLPASPALKAGPVVDVPDTYQGHGRVLVMDDDNAVCRAEASMLKGMGFQVECAADGSAAIELFRQAIEAHMPFTLAVLDLTVAGGMGGTETLAGLRRLDPDIAAIAASGYSHDPVIADPKVFGFSGSIAKPFLKAELARVLVAVLG
jgi:CheY-like chemotaxis protein